MTAWRAAESEIDALLAARHPDPFALLGPHETPAGLVVRAFVPGATALTLCAIDGTPQADLSQRHPDGVFEHLFPDATSRFPYLLEATHGSATWRFRDSFAFPPVLGTLDDHLLVEGTHRRLYERLGAHPMHHDGADGVHFAVWAPNAARVSVVGTFNDWDGRRHPMRKRVDSGLWEIFLPDLGPGAVYKYEILARDGRLLPLKADPFGFAAELRPSTASVVARTDALPFTDADYLAGRGGTDPRRAPMAIYEVHLGSWRRGPSGQFLSYDEL
ncbi:MAG: 1,4-alpha-glucan branching enzyme, partial [Rhodospirillales bacterium]|nr:1,4-alpha-glucan branching enzyme [Rhodospirillales bacterium]